MALSESEMHEHILEALIMRLITYGHLEMHIRRCAVHPTVRSARHLVYNRNLLILRVQNIENGVEVYTIKYF